VRHFREMPTTRQVELRDRQLVEPASCCVNTTPTFLRVARNPTEAARLAAASRLIVAGLVRERANRRTALVSVGSQNGTVCES
jgi:hypothetical protein